jgi:acetoacetyl-CoA synthetase
MTAQALWTPSPARRAAANLRAFEAFLRGRHGVALNGFREVQAYALREPEAFWNGVWDFYKVRASAKGKTVMAHPGRMPHAGFFPEASLNYAENVLVKSDDTPALIFRSENGTRSETSWRDLSEQVSLLQQALAKLGVGKGDRVCAVVPNHPVSIVGLLACASLGAIWSSCSPDFGERGILDRFGQIEPKVLLCCDGYFYGGKTFMLTEKIAAVTRQIPSLSKVIVFDYAGAANEVAAALPNGITLAALTRGLTARPVSFVQLTFDHPLYILYSSGTTGIPKCIVHGHGGILLKHLVEHVLNTDVKPGDRVFYFSTCGWMMWNWLVSGLAAGATLLLFDGSPFHPAERVLFDYAEAEGMTHFGTSAKYIDSLRKSGFRPKDHMALASLRSVMSTGSPLSEDGFRFIYEGVKDDVQLASISGGTDICGCFVGGNPDEPVYAGEIQGPMLGVAADVFDDEGKPVRGMKGELVCTLPFPSMPVMFWNDPSGEKYHNAYFARFEGLWCHGDFAEITPRDGMIIHGRSDATLNPGGVRIGTAEIYAQVERIPDVLEALAIGQDWQDDVRVVLFVRLWPGVTLSEDLVSRVKKAIREGASPRHVPAKIIAVADIPRTKSGKITELAVREVVHGRPVKNKEALANPEALDLYAGLPELQT